MFTLQKEYIVKKDDENYKNNILASFGLEIINLLKDGPIKIYSITDKELKKEDPKTKEINDIIVVKADITKLCYNKESKECSRIKPRNLEV